ncbi:MAG: hypothetical protein AVDCRST_MAG19-4877, partial [uncultured Thermomicrobiales bacterium]
CHETASRTTSDPPRRGAIDRARSRSAKPRVVTCLNRLLPLPGFGSAWCDYVRLAAPRRATASGPPVL